MSCCNDKKHIHHNHHPHNFVDVSKIEPVPWDEAPIVLGMTECGNIIPLEKPEHELTGEDRDKLDAITIDGDGNSFLSDDGTYKEVYSKEQIDEKFVVNGDNQSVDINSVSKISLSSINGVDIVGGTGSLTTTLNVDGSGVTINGKELLTESDIEGVVKYDQNNDIRPEKNVILKNNNKLSGTTLDGRELNLAELSPNVDSDSYPVANYGSISSHTNIISANRPTAQMRGETLEEAHEIAFLSDVEGTTEEIEQLENRVSQVETRVTSVEGRTTSLEGRVTTSENRIEAVEGDLGRLSGAVSDNTEAITELGTKTDSIQSDLDSFKESTESTLTAHDERITDNTNAITANKEEFDAFKDATNAGFEAVQEALTEVRQDIAENSTGIQTNADAIEALRQDFNDTEHFRGYYATTEEVTALTATTGDYAYNAETGTKWIYDGTIWEDSGVNVPDQTVDAYDLNPLMNGEASPGTSNMYSRGDHIHPSDNTKADKTQLNDYLPLSGNSQTTPVTSDVWIKTSAELKLSNSGNSFIRFEDEESTLEVKGNGTGGVDLQSDLGTIKANGQRIVTVGTNENVQISSPIVQLNATSGDNPASMSMAGGVIQQSAQAYLGSFSGEAGYTVNTTNGDIVLNPTTGKLYYGSKDFPLNEVARLSDIPSSGVGDKVSKSGDTMTGPLIMDNGADIVLDYNENNPSAIYGEDDNGSTFNLASLRVYISELLGHLDQAEFGSKAAQFNANSLYVPTVDMNANQNFDAQYAAAIPATKHRIVLDTWLKDNYLTSTDVNNLLATLLADYYTKEEIDALLSNIDLSYYYTKEQVDTLISSLEDQLSNYALKSGTTFTGNVLMDGANRTLYNSSGSYIGYVENTDTLSVTNEGEGGINLNSPGGTLKYNGVEIATIEDVENSKLTSGKNITILDGVISSGVDIALSDDILTYDTAGLKANLSLTTEGSDAILYGKNDSEGNPIEIGRINISFGAIEDAGYDPETNELYFIVNTPEGSQEIRIPVGDLIQSYTASGFLQIDSENDITLKYADLKDELLNDGFIDDLSEYSTTQQINTLLSGKANASDVYTKSQVDETVEGLENIISGKANSVDVYTKTEADNLLSSKANISQLSNYVAKTGDETIGGVKTFSNVINANGGLSWKGIIIPASSDLNTYTTEGIYKCASNASAQSLSNCPATVAFSMVVYVALYDNSYVTQIIYEFATATENAEIYVRNLNASTGDGVWRRMALASETPQFGTYTTITDLGGITHNLSNYNYDIRFTYGGSTVSSSISFTGGMEGMEYKISINNNGSGTLNVNLPTGDAYQSDDTQWTIEAGKVGILGINYIFGKYIMTIVQ